MSAGRLVLCSYGVNVNQLTPETLAALRECDVIFSQALSDGSKRSLERACPPIQALNDRGIDDVVELVAGQVKAGRKVAYLTYGEPMILNDVCEKLIERCEKEGFEHRIYSGISYLNELLSGLRLMTHACAGVYLGWPGAAIDGFNPAVPALIFLFGSKSSEPGMGRSLVQRIQRVYPHKHEVEVVTCSYSNPRGMLRKKYRIGDLQRAWEEVDNQSTLYIPAVSP